MTKVELLQDWQAYKKSAQAGVAETMEYFYTAEQRQAKKSIIEALTFWQFVFRKLSVDDQTKTGGAKSDYFLSTFVDNDNWMIGIIARIESMPTMVWRKILWRYNIDFMSLESFLRRLSPEQATAIVDNYEDLYVRYDIPRVFSKWDRFWDKITMEKIFAEGHVYDERYTNKAAMAYDLLKLGFGFNAYSKGVTDDTCVIEAKLLKFFSIKNHADDFVVNQEDGWYWWLYRAARNLMFLLPNKEIELKTHICPGFWYTIFIHLLFWVISPLAFISLAGVIVHQSLHETSWRYMVLLGIPGSLMPLWISAMTIKHTAIGPADNLGGEKSKTYRALVSFFNFMGKVDDYFKDILTSLSIVCLGILIGITMSFVYEGFGVSITWSVLTILTSCAYILCIVFLKDEDGYSYKMTTFPLYIRIPMIAMIIAIAAKLVLANLGGIETSVLFVAHGVLQLVARCWSGIALTLGLLVSGLIIKWAVFKVNRRLSILDEKKQQRFYDSTDSVIKSFFAVLCCVIIYVAFGGISLLLVYLIILGLIVYVQYCFTIWLENPRIKKAHKDIKYVERRQGWDLTHHKQALLNNAWFQSLDRDLKGTVLQEILLVVNKVFLFSCTKGIRQRAHKILLPNVTKEILNAIKRHADELRETKDLLALEIITEICSGKSYNDALNVVNGRLKKEKKRNAKIKAIKQATEAVGVKLKVLWEKIRKVMVIIFRPVTFLFILVKKGVVKIIEFMVWLIRSLHYMYKLFNQRCPFIVKKEVLKI